MNHHGMQSREWMDFLFKMNLFTTNCPMIKWSCIFLVSNSHNGLLSICKERDAIYINYEESITYKATTSFGRVQNPFGINWCNIKNYQSREICIIIEEEIIKDIYWKLTLIEQPQASQLDLPSIFNIL